MYNISIDIDTDIRGVVEQGRGQYGQTTVQETRRTGNGGGRDLVSQLTRLANCLQGPQVPPMSQENKCQPVCSTKGETGNQSQTMNEMGLRGDTSLI